MEYEKIQSLGVLCLGGVVLALDDSWSEETGLWTFHATNYRAEQQSAKLCFVAHAPSSSGHAWSVHSATLPIAAGDAGAELFRVVVSASSKSDRDYQVFGPNDEIVLSGAFSTRVPLGTKANISLTPPQQRRWQELFIRSEVELRRFRSVLRSRAVRVGLKEIDHELRFYAREVEEALQSEEEQALNEALQRLRGAELRIQDATGIAPFPNNPFLALLPEP